MSEVINVEIKDIKEQAITGVSVAALNDNSSKQTGYFEWTQSSLKAELKSSVITGGTIRAWRHEPVFTKCERHEDAELFFFVSGVALMLFLDYKDDVPDINTAQIARIYPGTQIVIEAGKGHYVPMAEGDTPVCAIVSSPVMPAPVVKLPKTVCGK